MSKSQRIPPTHPGEILLGEYMKPYTLSANALATDLGLPATRIGDIIHQRRGITAEAAIALAEYFKTSAEFWLGIQMQYDKEIVEDEIDHRVSIARSSSGAGRKIAAAREHVNFCSANGNRFKHGRCRSSTVETAKRSLSGE